MFRAYLLSFLARQRLVLNEKFQVRYPHHWLVWEPGSWKAPPANAAVAETRLPQQGAPARPMDSGDALCFELSVKKEAAQPVRLGRAEENELVISDFTVSREHCTLRLENDAWHVKVGDSVKSMKVGGHALSAGSEARIEPGQQLELGEVTLTFLDPKRFLERVSARAAQMKS